MDHEKEWDERREQKGITRRDFLKFCTVVAGALGLDPAFGPKIFEAFAAGPRPRVLWLHFAECTGCTEAVLRTSSPGFADLIFDVISLEYHETLMAAAGDTVEKILTTTAQTYSGQFFCVVEGAIPTADGGVYGWIGGRTCEHRPGDLPQGQGDYRPGQLRLLWGASRSLAESDGCGGSGSSTGHKLACTRRQSSRLPAEPSEFRRHLANYLLKGSLPSLDADRRPVFAYGNTVHSQCPYRENESRCLEDFGCKGKICHNNCPTIKFNDATSFPMQAGHPCIGCSEPDFWDRMTPFYQEGSDGEGSGSESRSGSDD